MTFPTFNSGDTLLASDMNAVGVWRIGGATFSNVASFDVTGFSSSYDFYQLNLFIGSNAAGSSTVTAQIYSGATVRNTNYYGGQFYVNNAAGTGTYAIRNNAANFGVTDTTLSPGSLINAWISGIGNGRFNINLQQMGNNSVAAYFGGYSNYAATNSFDMIRFSGTANITGFWQLMGVKKS